MHRIAAAASAVLIVLGATTSVARAPAPVEQAARLDSLAERQVQLVLN